MAQLTEIVFEPRHWNQNCGCMIPAAWVGIVSIDDPLSPISTTKILGDSREDVLTAAKSNGIQICL